MDLKSLVNEINEIVKQDDLKYNHLCTNCSRKATLTLLTLDGGVIGFTPNCEHCGTRAVAKNEQKRTKTKNPLIWKREIYRGRVAGGRVDFFKLLEVDEFKTWDNPIYGIANYLRYHRIPSQLSPSNAYKLKQLCQQHGIPI